MNQYVLSLGSNLPPRKNHLQTALVKLSEFSTLRKISPLFENPPLLPSEAPESWYQFFLNAAVWIETELAPETLLDQLNSMERAAGRTADRATWAPRPLDIDIILLLSKTGEPLTYHSPRLQIPHPAWEQRNFVVTPIMHLLKGTAAGTALSIVKKHRELLTPLCAFSAILNATPDSFAEDPQSQESPPKKMQRLLKLHPALLDLGAESTRPGATSLTPAEEWARLEPLLGLWKEIRHSYPFTQLSLDTRHAQTAEQALAYNVSVLNDVGGLTSLQMQDVATQFEATILMHSLSVPADPKTVLPKNQNAGTELKAWLENKLATLPQALLAKLIFDPGIGFGKTPLQSLSLLQNLNEFKSFDLPLLIGHSRKSFMNLWCDETFSERDFETLGVSGQLLSQAEFLRIHNLEAHQRLQKSQLALAGAL